MNGSNNQDKCRWCGESYADHLVARQPGDPVPRMPCGGMRSLFQAAPFKPQRRVDWADDWADALHTLFLDDGDEAQLFRRIRVALLAAHQGGLQGDSLFATELPPTEASP
jgi:hypothetical protein